MRVRIISLGEIVTPNINKTILGLAHLIHTKSPTSEIADITKQLGGVLQTRMNLLNDFKLGRVEENDFDQQMLSAIEQSTGVKLSTDEFNQCWSAMCPEYAQFSALLDEAVEFNKMQGQKLIFISFTNPKDIRHLRDQLDKNNISYRVDGEQLTELNSIKLVTTYASRLSKAELIDQVYKEARAEQSTGINLGYFMPAQKSTESVDVKYIRGVNNINDPILKADLEQTNQQVEMKAASLAMETIIWEKYAKMSLSDALNSKSAAKIVPGPML